jgi:hypothetical protein
MPKRSTRQRCRRAARTSSLVGLPSGQTRLQTTSRAQPFVNADVLQIITEYTAQISSILCQRRVSKRWYGAVTQAIGFLNDRDWTSLRWWSVAPLSTHFTYANTGAIVRMACLRERLERLVRRWYCAVTQAIGFLNGRNWKSLDWWRSRALQLSTHFTYANSGAIVRFVAVCLRERLERLVILRSRTFGTRRERWSLRLLGERNDCLKHLYLCYIDVRDVAVLGRFSALEEVRFEDCTFDVLDVAAFVEMPALKELSLSGCQRLDLTLLHQCKSLLSMNLDLCQFVDNGSVAMLAQISSLTFLSLSHCVNVTNVSPLSSCLALEQLTLNRTSVDAAGIEGLARIPTLRKLHLRECHRLRDVTCLQRCVALETLALNGSAVTSEGLRGLENISTLRSLNVSQCDVSTVVGLTPCCALKSLDLSRTNVDDAGITGLENIASLTQLDLKGCRRITSVCLLRMSRSIRGLNLSETGITAAGLVGLNEIPTLEIVALENCQQLTDVRSLRGCRSLRRLCLAGTPIVDGGLEGLGSIAHFVPVVWPWL